MAFLETANFCGLNEYTDERERRVLETGLEIDGLYMYMMRLRDGEKQAAKQPVRIDGAVREAGFVMVKFAFLDDNLQTSFESSETMSDGIINDDEQGRFCSYATGEQYVLVEAYLRDYFDYGLGGILATSQALLV